MAAEASRQTYRTVMGRVSFISGVTVISALVVACVVIVIISINIKYAPPGLDPGAESGAPIVDEGYLYRQVDSDFGYSFSLAANLYRQEDGSVNIYLTNPQENKYSIMCEIFDADSEETLYKSGRIMPGYYLENIPPKKEFENVARDILIRVYAFENESFTSAGTTELKLRLQAW